MTGPPGYSDPEWILAPLKLIVVRKQFIITACSNVLFPFHVIDWVISEHSYG